MFSLRGSPKTTGTVSVMYTVVWMVVSPNAAKAWSRSCSKGSATSHLTASIASDCSTRASSSATNTKLTTNEKTMAKFLKAFHSRRTNDGRRTGSLSVVMIYLRSSVSGGRES